MDISLLTPDTFRQNESLYLKQIENAANWSNIPLLNYRPLAELRPLSLVRFRGMIQDMSDPEIYLEQYEVSSPESGTRIQDGKYRDCLVLEPNENLNYSSPRNTYGERRVLFSISIPGLNGWASKYEETSCRTQILRDDMKDNTGVFGTKRSLEDNHGSADTEMQKLVCKRVKNIHANIPASPIGSYLSPEYLLNSPLPERPSKACMVKIYSDFDSYVLNSVVDVVGFLSVDQSLDGSTESGNDFQELCEIQASNPSPSLIPRLHAIIIKKLLHPNPLLDVTFLGSDASRSNLESARKNLHVVLTQCLFGDEVAATYLLSHLISTVYVRTELQTLGQFSLNICNIPSNVLPEYTKALYGILESLLPASHYFPMTLENMNSVQFTPKKDYKTNKLVSGLLQLAPQTHLVLDETRLQPGTLETNGVLAVQKIAHLIKSQQIKYDFEFYEIDFNADIPILVLSEGRSMLPYNFQISLNPDQKCVELISETLKAAMFYLQPNLNAIRKFLTIAKLQEFNINSSDTEMIEKDFVELRKFTKNVGAEDLHSLLILSRLQGIARGKTFLDRESWEIAMELEKERKMRLNNDSRRK